MGIGFGKNCSVYGEQDMGACHITRRRSCGVYAEPVIAPNPDPARFEIMKTVQIGRNVVAKIRYPDCTNFEGEKICLYLNVTVSGLRDAIRLDPHFSDDRFVLSPFARFKPTTDGWNIAVKVAEKIK